MIESPVGQVHHPHAPDQHRDARQVLIVRVVSRQDHVELFRRLSKSHLETRQRALAAGYGVQRDISDHQPSEHQEDHLDDVRQGHCLQASVQRIGNGEQSQQYQRVLVVEAGNGVNRQCAQPQDRGQVHEDVDAQPEYGQNRAHAAVVTLLQELGHGVDAVL